MLILFFFCVSECQLRKDVEAICSPAVHECCTPECQILPAEEQSICGGREECMKLTYCDGKSFLCPEILPMPNDTLCSAGTKVQVVLLT